MVVGVLVEISNKSVDKIFDYSVPKELEDKIKIGIRVEVPFGYRSLEGFVLEIKKESELEKIKDIISIVDEDIILNDELITLGKKMRDDTISTLISCYQVMLPKALKAKNNYNAVEKFETYYRLKLDKNIKYNSKQQEIIDCFKKSDLVSRKQLLIISASSIKTLVSKNVLIEEKCEKYRINYNDKIGNKKKLTDEQENVVSQVRLDCNDIYLLHGVTGSGKTEVYISLIDKVIKSGKTAIMLVPEISLTPQMVIRFEQVFGNEIAALHSALSDGEKYDEWRRINRGEVKIVIGARSAVFAPLNNIGIIIVDEEHSESYKQDSNPRYSAKNIAITRSIKHNCPVIFGSATPELDAYARAQKGIYKLLELPNRVSGSSLPNVEIVDMNDEIKYSKGHFSRKLIKEIDDRLEKKQQIILLLNRRGYSSFVSCKNCGYTVKCPNCDISLTYHKTSNIMRCHYCGYGTKMEKKCSECHDDGLSTLGIGTEKIEEEINKYFENARVLRMDIDTTSKKGMHKKMIESFKNHEYDILLGTQMVAKGLDFSLVTLVGVINADTSLNIPDYKSSENTFSLLNQVSGRSGRSSLPGNVIIQTYNPDHYAIKYTKKHDYKGFYLEEMNIRKKLKYPPYYYICYVRISGDNYDEVSNESRKIKNSLDRNLLNTIILGPTPASVFKVNNIFRYGIILKYKKEDNLYEILNKINDHYKDNKNIMIDIDFNPNHF